jgi:MYXO-CTERM domain-containing protein
VVDAAPTALTLSSSNNPATALSPVTFTVRLTVNGQSAGAGNAIRLGISGQTINLTTDSTGSATCIISTLTPASYPVTASFAATNNLLASSASLTEVITAVPTSISLSGTPNPGDVNQPVSLTAKVSSGTTSAQVSSGSVAFYDGATSIGSAQVSANGTAGSTASLSVSFAAVGVHDITAVYAANAIFATSTSPVFKETIVAGDFSISVLPGTATVYTGEAAAMQVSVTSLQGFNQPLALTCAGLPADTTCTFSPASLMNGQGSANLVIQTIAPHQSGSGSGSISGSMSGSSAALGALTLLLLPGWRRRRRLLAALSFVLLAAGIGMGVAGCGSPNPISGGTPPGTYQVAVTATAAGGGTPLTHSAVVTLTVKSLF